MVWSHVDEPALGPYGSWEAANPDCVALGLTTSKNTKMILLLFASICACQVLFMASRAPRITWEAVYLPLIETILYAMASTGNGQLRLGDGRVLPIARYCSWLITCPIMLFQVVGLYDLKLWGISCKHMVMAAALIRTVFGIGASVTLDDQMRWVQFFLSYSFFFFELYCAYMIFGAALKQFGEVRTTLNSIVYSRIMLLRFIFFLSWNSFGIIWLLSSTGLCMISEDVSVLAYLAADMLCKNTYGIINANTLFRVLDGKWTPETLEEAASGVKKANPNHVGETYLERMMAGIRGSAKPEEDPVAALPQPDAPDIKLNIPPGYEGGVGYPYGYGRDQAELYSHKMAHPDYAEPPQKLVPRDGRPYTSYSYRRGQDGRRLSGAEEDLEGRYPMPTPDRGSYRDDGYFDAPPDDRASRRRDVPMERRVSYRDEREPSRERRGSREAAMPSRNDSPGREGQPPPAERAGWFGRRASRG